jgi:hypothetical protein
LISTVAPEGLLVIAKLSARAYVAHRNTAIAADNHSRKR